MCVSSSLLEGSFPILHHAAWAPRAPYQCHGYGAVPALGSLFPSWLWRDPVAEERMWRPPGAAASTPPREA